VNTFTRIVKMGQKGGNVRMKKLLASILVAGMALVPVLSLAAEVPALTPVQRATKAAADADLIYQQALALQVKVQQEADLAAANVAKATEDLKIAVASGDQAKIKAATDALKKAKFVAADATRKVRAMARQVERLKVFAERAKQAAAVAASPDIKVAEKAANDAEGFAARAVRVSKSIEEILKPRPAIDIIGVTIPPTTTSTTQPSPTPVGERG
jgi:hypothetical protein